MAVATGGARKRIEPETTSARGAGNGFDSSFLGAVRLGADTLARLATEPDWSVERADALLRLVAARHHVEVGLAQAAITSRALRDPQLQTLPPGLAAEAILRILALGPIRGASLWKSPQRGRPACAATAGDEPCLRHACAAARAVLAGRTPRVPAGLLAVSVRCWERPVAALVVAAEPAGRSSAQRLAAEAGAALRVVLEREALLERGQERERLLVEASERRLARLAFDLHDGALQTVASLGLELVALTADLADRDGAGVAERVLALHERAGALEAELRELTRTLEPSTIARRALEATLAEQVEAFGAHHGIAARFECRGDLTGLTPSQRIALVRVVHEALANAREHGGATSLLVEVSGARSGIRLGITDDGGGFEPERVLPAAARKGRLGLVGMSERVRLLGGRLDVESRPGGPTRIEAFVPRWRPLTELAQPAAASAIS